MNQSSAAKLIRSTSARDRSGKPEARGLCALAGLGTDSSALREPLV